ncbi:aminotransferase class V-fold PLP-dependent enzyme [Candidatus Kaiserbacteria bacterium]|nr:aminotransferase class V-fold PLP-dependent enzyme [Candidatus Kaiserbacteria bacterium]
MARLEETEVHSLERVRGARDTIVKKLEWMRREAAASTNEIKLPHPYIEVLDDCVAKLKRLDEINLKNIQQVLSRHEDVLGPQIVHLEKDLGLKLMLRESEYKALVQSRCADAINSALCFEKRGGDFLLSVIPSMKNVESRTERELRELHDRLLLKGYSSSDAAMVYVMFACLSAHTPVAEGLSNDEVLLDTLSRIVENHTKLDPAIVREEGERGSFFKKLSHCISVYADITQEVIRRAPRTGMKIQQKATKALSLILQEFEQEPPRRRKKDVSTEPFDIAQRVIRRSKLEDNPWLTSSLKDTPFDDAQFWKLFAPDAHTSLLAESIVGLNNYQAGLLAHRARDLYNIVSGAIYSKRKLSDERRQQCEQLVADFFKAFPGMRKGRSIESEDLIDWLEEIRRLEVWPTAEELRQRGHIHPIATLLRIISPEKIVADDSKRQEFLRYFRDLKIPEVPKSDSDSIQKTHRKISIIAESIRAALDESSPSLNVPLIDAPGDKSLRTILTEFAANFDQDIRDYGPYIHLNSTTAPVEPLYTPIDIKDMSLEAMEHLKQDFDTAGIGYPRAWIQAAAKVMCRRYGYERTKEYAKAAVRGYHGTGGPSDPYEITFYRSATGAIADVVGNLLRLQEGNRVMITNQEFDGITKQFTKHTKRMFGKEDVIEMNDRNSGRSLEVDELFEQYRAKIGEDKTLWPRAILMSTKTRYGDAFCAGEGTKPNIVRMRKLISLLKETYPEIPIFVDACQSFGRNDEGENNLKQLGCDVYFTSGGKAMGTPEAATLILRTKYPEGQPHWLSWLKGESPMDMLLPGDGTDNIESIAALGIAMEMQSGRVDTWRLTPIQKNRSLRDSVTEHNRKMTEYFIQTAEAYHMDLFTDPNFPRVNWGVELRDDPKHAEQFGCHVVYPVHRVREQYNFVEVTFPNIGYLETASRKIGKGKEEIGDDDLIEDSNTNLEMKTRTRYFEQKLSAKGFNALHRLHKDKHGIRFSFNLAQDTGDIDALFKAIREIHIEYLKDRIEVKKIRTFGELCEGTLNVPSEWMPN